MVKLWLSSHRSNLLMALLLILVAAVCYLPLAHQFGFYRDDWYLIYLGTSQGAAKFTEVFAIDRPFRAPLVSFFFNLFGANAPMYSYTAFIARILGALGLYWIARMVWPKATMAAWAMTLLFVAYPGFLDMPNAFDFQSHIWAFTLAMLSIALSVRAALAGSLVVRAGAMALAAVFQLVYLALMEYFIGIEGLRIVLLVYIFVKATLPSSRFKDWFTRQTMQGMLHGLACSAPALLVSTGFMIWRQFFFQNQRGATDIGGMISGIAETPWLKLIWEPVNLIRDLLNVIVFAWAVPAYDLTFQLRLRDSLLVLGLGLLTAFLVWLVCRLKSSQDNAQPDDNEEQDGWGMLWVGLAGAALALIPIHLGDRQIIFREFSRFSLTASAGAAILLAGLCKLGLRGRFRSWSLALLLGLAVITHNANAISFVSFTKLLNTFWWQVSWRIPQIEPGTVLAANYGGQRAAEDYFIWGPANLIYYPSMPVTKATPLMLTAVTLERQDVYTLLAGKTTGLERRGTFSLKNYANLLILSMPTPQSCVHVLDGQHLALSDQENETVSLLAPGSQPGQIRLDESLRTPPELIFGREPARRWCYYYEKADLARQQGDWKEIVRLGDEALSQDLRPMDWVEWMPFVEAYAYIQRNEEFRWIASIIRENPFLHEQACQLARQDSPWAEQYAQGRRWLHDMFCQSE